jgi:hypothetical protein
MIKLFIFTGVVVLLALLLVPLMGVNNNMSANYVWSGQFRLEWKFCLEWHILSGTAHLSGMAL